MMRRSASLWLAFLGVILLPSCAFTGVEDLASLRDKPPLPYSVMITGGGFVTAPNERVTGELSRTFLYDDRVAEAFTLKKLQENLGLAKVFVVTATDDGPAADRTVVSGLGEGQSLEVAELSSMLGRAQQAGHDFLLIVEKIQDGPVESRGINDRWPFTLAAWLFALGALIPDRTYESRARLRVSMRDVYSGRQVVKPIVVEPGPVDLNMFERCGLLGFVQSIVIPPFFTSTDPASIVESIRDESTPRMLTSLVRRLKSAEVRDQLQSASSLGILTQRVEGGWQVSVETEEPVSSVGLRLDGRPLQTPGVTAFERELLESRQRTETGLQYTAVYTESHEGQYLQVAVQTEAAKVRSMTVRLAGE